ncbi:hypothetical protein RZS28_14280 [Methylocapsa polymorpha]|uniref:Membrane fusion protein biotin-lipoyl like domain-containing protein n=1 Tax=Methylocapsa polymorpha TaxID=3080828 RepID=A0ABZ0HQT7_9HYPH|nr:hypothetical protein RZS28_14280 [Methylocapsa sp. RX1]
MKCATALVSLELGRLAAASALIWLFGVVCLGGICSQAAEPPKSVNLGGSQTTRDGAGTPVIVIEAAPACFSAAVRVTGFLTPRADAIVSLTPDGFEIAEIFAGEGDLVREGQQLARLARIGGAMPEPAVRPKPRALRPPPRFLPPSSCARRPPAWW